MKMLGHKSSKATFLIGKQVKHRIRHFPKEAEVMPQHLARITVLNLSGNIEVGFKREVI